MMHAYHLGGWGMYPTTLFGLVLIWCAIGYARDPDRRRLALVRALSFVTFLAACLGFTAGVIRTFTTASAMPAADVGNVVVAGVGESLTNIGLGLGMLVVAWLFASAGAFRAGPSGGRPDLHAP